MCLARDELSQAAKALRGFPSNIKDSCDGRPGATEAKVAGGGEVGGGPKLGPKSEPVRSPLGRAAGGRYPLCWSRSYRAHRSESNCGINRSFVMR